MKYIDELYSQIEKEDKNVIQNLCNFFVNWTIYYAKIVYANEPMPFEKYLDNVTVGNLKEIGNVAYLSATYAPDNLAYNVAIYVSDAADYAAKRVLPGVGKCMDEAANLAKKWVNGETDYEKESQMIRIALLENALGVKQ